jgi:excisionase family DNA binding protein
MTTTMIPGVTPADAAKRLGLTTQRIRQLLASGQLAYTQTALGRLIDEDDLQRLISEREQAASQPGARKRMV